MLIEYLKNLWRSFINSKLVTKIITCTVTAILVFFTVISFWKVDYVIYTPGFLTSPVGTVSIDSDNTSGIIRMVSVISYDKPSLIQLWASKLDKRLLVEKVDEDYSYDQEKPISITSKWISINKAIMYAYERANEINPEVNLVKTFMGVIVYYAADEAHTNLESSDIIVEVEGTKINSYDELLNIYNSTVGVTKFAGDYINFKTRTRSSDVLQERSAKIYEDSSSKLTTGLVLDEYYNLDGENSYPKFSVNYQENVDSSGNSGGAMLCLSIYNRLINEDITNGKIIVGTGTIDTTGFIGRIGCVEQKVVKAYQNNADCFFVCNNVYYDNSGNPLKTDYELCLEAAKSYGYDTDFIKPVKTFDDILNVLEQMKGGNNGE